MDVDWFSSVDEAASDLARAHGSFSLWFDANNNYVRPDDSPWVLEIGDYDGKKLPAFAGYTALEAIAAAAAALRPVQGGGQR